MWRGRARRLRGAAVWPVLRRGDRLAAILRPKDGAAQLTGQGWAETRDICVIPRQCGQPFSRLNAFGGKELGLGALLPVVLQCHDQDRAQTQTADCGGKGDGPAG